MQYAPSVDTSEEDWDHFIYNCTRWNTQRKQLQLTPEPNIPEVVKRRMVPHEPCRPPTLQETPLPNIDAETNLDGRFGQLLKQSAATPHRLWIGHGLQD